MKLKQYLRIKHQMTGSDFKKLSAKNQEKYRREHAEFNRQSQIAEHEAELERENAYAILYDIGVPFCDGEPVGIWSDD